MMLGTQIFASYILGLWGVVNRRLSVTEDQLLDRVFSELLIGPLFFESPCDFQSEGDIAQWTRRPSGYGPTIIPIDQWHLVGPEKCKIIKLCFFLFFFEEFSRGVRGHP